MKGRGKAWRYSKAGTELLPEVAGELGTTIRNNIAGEAVKFPDMMQEEIRKVRGTGGGSTGDKVMHLGESIHYHPYGVVSV